MAIEFNRRLIIAFALIAFVAGIGAIGYAYWVASRIDALSVDRQTTLMVRALEETGGDLSHQQQTVTVWDDAVTHARSADQAWLAANMGEWMHSFFGHDQVYILDPHDVPIYAMQGGRTVAPASFAAVAPQLVPLVERLRQMLRIGGADRGSAELRDLLVLGGSPALVGLKAIVPSTNLITVPADQEYIHISIIDFTPAYVRDLGMRHLIPEATFKASRPSDSALAALPVSGSGGTIGYLTWPALRPGMQALGQTAPIVGFAATCLLGLAFWLARLLGRTAAELQASERRTAFLAFHDALTGLPNRARFSDRLANQIKGLEAGEAIAFLFIDLDRFKNINDTLGHAAGDELLVQVSSRIQSLADGDAGSGEVARFGGDEFAVMLRCPIDESSLGAMAERVLTRIREPYELLGNQAYIDASIGIAIAPADGIDPAELGRKSDIALYEAKRLGRGRWSRFSEAMDHDARRRQQIEVDLRAALTSGNQFELEFQPVYSGRSGSPIGAEALIRWRHPKLGSLSPAVFIPVAEESGLIREIGEWALDRACSVMDEIGVPWIAVNASSIEVRDPDYAPRVLAILDRHGVSPHRLQIEITESVLLDSDETVLKTLRQLREAGIRIALDDFGTGYSSLRYLHQYPVDKIKIDRAFVRPLGDDPNADAIVRAILDLEHAFHISVTAEGIETSDQYDRLVGMGCGELPGFLLSRPVSCASLKRMLEQHPQAKPA